MAETDHTHTHDEFYPTVSAVIIHDDKVLLRRDQQHYSWLSPSSHIDLHETPLDALFRHVQRETGLRHQHLTVLATYADNMSLERDEAEGFTRPMPFDLNIQREGNGQHMHVDSAYILISSTDELTPEVDTPPELQWFNAEQLEELMLTTKITTSRALYALKKYKENPPQ